MKRYIALTTIAGILGITVTFLALAGIDKLVTWHQTNVRIERENELRQKAYIDCIETSFHGKLTYLAFGVFRDKDNVTYNVIGTTEDTACKSK